MTEADKQIRSAKTKLKKLYADIPPNRHDLAAELIDNVAFIGYQLQVLRGQILEHGMVSLYDNGKITQDVVSPYAKAYNQLYPKYIQSISALNKMLPAGLEPPISPVDELSEFEPGGGAL